jgi:uncharacterized protein (TIGR03000 family)
MWRIRPFIAVLSVVVSVPVGAVTSRPASYRAHDVAARLEPPRALAERFQAPFTLDGGTWIPWQQGRGAVAATQVRSRIRVLVPRADAELAFEHGVTDTTGTVREWDSAPLEPGRIYRYTFTVKWRPNNYTLLTREKIVRFKAGDPVVVDLSQDDPNDRAQIRYVPTPDFVVAEMIKLAGIRKDDVVFEPGCGDARVTIAAVKAGARRGVGIDLAPERVADSLKNVRAAKLEGKIDIRLGDALDIKDLSDASVVFLYMGEEFDLLIRPRLWEHLKVGARVVSHRFEMGDWMPDRTVTTAARPTDDDIYLVHLWTITKEVKARAAKP